MGGRFITFEGVDGCGKSTQARLLAERLRAAGLDVLETREPGGTAIGAQLRAVLLDEDNAALTPQAELLLYLADRVQHLEETIRPALAAGRVVVCDRFHDATVAYQQHGRGLDLTPFAGFIAAEVLRPPPDLTFWLDVDVEEARRRMTGRQTAIGAVTGEGRLDNAAAAFHHRVREGYRIIQRAEPGRVERIDAAGSPAQLHQRIVACLKERYGGL